MPDSLHADDPLPVSILRAVSRHWPLPSPVASTYVLREPEPGLTADLDGVWKHALQTWLPECLALFWPKIHRRIDWRVAPTFLDQELRKLGIIRKEGTKHVDVLAQVQLLGGGQALLLLHLEVQAGPIDAEFRQRMFHYRIRLYDKHSQIPILSCAILLDRDQGPDLETFHYQGLGDELIFHFPVVNLASWRRRLPTLERLAPTNPFAVIVIAYLEYRATRPDAKRLTSKLRLAQALAKWGYDKARREAVFLIIDSLLLLPEALEERFTDILTQAEDPIVQQLTSVQRVILRREKAASREEGEIQGEIRGEIRGQIKGAAIVLQAQLQQKFGPLPDWVKARIAAADTEALQRWALNVLQAERLEAVFDERA